MSETAAKKRDSTGLTPLGFGYLLDGDTGFDSENNPSLPVLCAPLAFDGETVSATRFDPAVYNGRAALLRINLSAISLRVHANTGELEYDGYPRLATGEGTVWGTGITPRVATPEPQ